MVKKEEMIVALDVPRLGEAERLVRRLAPVVGTFKIGMELFSAEGPRAVRMIHSHKARVFLDLKFHDIPNTVGSACAAAARLGVFMLNIHASGGKNMMLEARRCLREAAAKKKIKPPILLSVTVLTSLTDGDLREVGIAKKTGRQVKDLAVLSKESGLDGVVASACEIPIIRKAVRKPFLIVTPGARPAWAAKNDQKRVTTPKEALDLGADFIVVGRPITRSADPREAAERILDEMC